MTKPYLAIVRQLRKAERETENDLQSIRSAIASLGSSTAAPRKHRISAAGRLAISRAQKARWAKYQRKAV